MNEDFIKQFIQTKRFKYISSIFLLVLFSISLSLTFSSFTNNYVDELANVKLAGHEYNILINGLPENIIEVKANSTNGVDLVITSLNMIDAKYGITYQICSDSTCTNFIEKPSDLEIASSSLSSNSITGTIGAGNTIESRLILINTSNINYYVKLKLNSGFIHNTLSLENDIANVIEEKLLKEGILSNEGGIATIEAKPSPDFSQISPIVYTYAEKTTDYTEILLSNNNKAIGSGYTFNKEIGAYTLTNYVTGKSYGTEYINFYTCGHSSGSKCSSIYKIIEVDGTNITKAIKYHIDPETYDLSDSGMYATEDDYGTSYYYRGYVDNNFVVFAGMCWRTVRIVGDGSIKLILYNYNPNLVFNPCAESEDGDGNAFARYGETNYKSAFNTEEYDNKYVGYMYGEGSSQNFPLETVFNNVIDSTIKENLNTWYNNNLSSYSSYLADTLWCNDRETYPADLVDYQNYYKAHERIETPNPSPTYKCSQKNDRFTVSDTVVGNAKANVPIGLLTSDEVAFAGGIHYTNLFSIYYGFYLYNNTSGLSWWTLSPCFSSYGAAYLYSVRENYIEEDYSTSENGLRPVISLKHSMKVIGLGTSSNPYKVIYN